MYRTLEPGQPEVPLITADADDGPLGSLTHSLSHSFANLACGVLADATSTAANDRYAERRAATWVYRYCTGELPPAEADLEAWKCRCRHLSALTSANVHSLHHVRHLPGVAAIAILLAAPPRTSACENRRPARVTGSASTAALIDRLGADGVVLTYGPQDRTLRADGDAAVPIYRTTGEVPRSPESPEHARWLLFSSGPHGC